MVEVDAVGSCLQGNPVIGAQLGLECLNVRLLDGELRAFDRALLRVNGCDEDVGLVQVQSE